jgi:mannan endo-1,4-beta-mannosidase
VNPDTLPEARQLLEYFYAVRGKHILAGQHNYPGTLSAYTDEVFELTGRFPVIWGQDFGFTAEGKDGIVHRDAIIQEAIKRYQQGYIVTLMWHAVRPTDNEPNGWKSSVQNELEQARTLYKDSRVLTRCQVQWRR